MKKLFVALSAIFMAFLIAVVIFIVLVGSIIQRLNPMCLMKNAVMTQVVAPFDKAMLGLQAIGDLVAGDDDLDQLEEKLNNATIIYQVGKAMAPQGITDRDIVTALTTSSMEARLINHGHLGDRNNYDSIGLFQQRPSQGWGTAAQVHNPVYASQKFYEALLEVPDRQNMSINDAAQAVQSSAHPNGYAEWEDEGQALFDWLSTSNRQIALEDDTSIAVIGDSLTTMAHNYIHDDLYEAGYTHIWIDAQGARSTWNDSEWHFVPSVSGPEPDRALAEQPLISGVSAVQRVKASGFDPRDWLILLGTNDIAGISLDPQQGQADAREVINPIMEELGPDKRVLWLTVWSTKYPDQSQMFNQTLKQMAAEQSNLFVGDWAELVLQNPGWLIDSVHYSTEGSQQRSSFLSNVAGFMTGAVPGISQIFSMSAIAGGLFGGCDFNSPTAFAANTDFGPVTGQAQLNGYKVEGIEEQQSVTRCSGGQRVGTRELSAHVAMRWQPTFSGGYSCRGRSTDSSKLSIHGDGRAIDQGFSAFNAEELARGNNLFGWLIANAAPLGIQYIKFWKLAWSPSKGLRCVFNPEKPKESRADIETHSTHIHYELNPPGAERQTPWFTSPTDYPPVVIDQSLC